MLLIFPIFHTAGLTISQLGMLLNLNGSVDGKLPMKELEAALHVVQSTASGIASRLESKGIIESFGDPDNKKIKIVGIILSACFLIFMDPLLKLIGASKDTWKMTKTYLTIVSLCGPFVLIANCYNNIIRAEGQSTKAMMGQLIGNVAGALYYIIYFLRGKFTLSINIRDFKTGDKVMSGVLTIGIPACSQGSFCRQVSCLQMYYVLLTILVIYLYRKALKDMQLHTSL